MSKLNVCLINDSFPPVIDGVSNTIFNYANIINKELGNVVVATPEYPNVVDNYPYDVLRYKSVDTTKIIGYRAGIPLSVKFLSQFNDRNIDIIHTHCPVTSLILARILREQIKKPIILTYHTKFDIDIKNAVNNKFIQDAAINALVSNIEAADEVWAVSKGAGESLKSLGYKGDYIVMPNGVDFTKGRATQKEIDEVRKTYNLPTDMPIFLFVGRMMWYKGIKIIIDALKEVKNHAIDFRMLFVGNGADYDEVNEYVDSVGLKNKCIFTGAITDRAMLKAIFSTCDLFLFPSTYDTNGIVVREAAAAELGSVLVKGSCAAEDTEDGTNALWIEENSESLAKILINNGSNLDYYHQIGKNAQRDLYISWEDSVNHAYARYQEVLNSYQYNDTKSFNQQPIDMLLGLWANLSNGLTKAKQTRDFINDQSKEIKDRITKTLDEVKETQTMINYRREEIEEYLNDVFDRYL